MLLLFQEFEFEVIVRPDKTNVGLDHLSIIDTGDEVTGIEDDLPNAHLFQIEDISSDLVKIGQFLEEGWALEGMSDKKKKIPAMKTASYTIVNKLLYKLGLDDVFLITKDKS